MTKTRTRPPAAPGRWSGPRTGPALLAAAVFAGALAAGPATAAPLSGLPLDEVHDALHTRGRTDFLAIIAALSDAGYEILSTDVTLLNRVRIRADNGSHLREIVVSRASGRVLRDVVVQTRRPSVPVPLGELLDVLPDGTIRTRQDGN